MYAYTRRKARPIPIVFDLDGRAWVRAGPYGYARLIRTDSKGAYYTWYGNKTYFKVRVQAGSRPHAH